MKVILTLFILLLVQSKDVVDTVTFEIKPSPKNINDLLTILDKEIERKNSSSIKRYEEASVKYQVNREKYSSMLISSKSQMTSVVEDINSIKKELQTLTLKRNALVQVKQNTKEIDQQIIVLKQNKKDKEKALKDINKRSKQLQKEYNKVNIHWEKAQKKRSNEKEFINKRINKINQLKEVISLAIIKNKELKALSQEFINSMVCGNKIERETFFLMKNKTDKNSKRLMKLLQDARNLAEKLTQPKAKDIAKMKFKVQVEILKKNKAKSKSNIEELEKKLTFISQKIQNTLDECKIAAGVIKSSCESKLNTLKEGRKNIKNEIRKEKSKLVDINNEYEKIKTQISEEVAQQALKEAKVGRQKMHVWMERCKKQIKDAREITGKLAIEEMEGCGTYQEAVINKRQMVVDRLVMLKQRRKEVYGKYVQLLEKEEKAVNKHIEELSKSGDKYEKSALVFAKYESKGVFEGNQRSEEMKKRANEQRRKAADQADLVISEWRILSREENKEIEELQKKAKEMKKEIKGIEEGLIRIDHNITIGIKKDELQEINNEIVMKHQVLKKLYSIIKKMVRRSVGKNAIMRKAAISRLVDLKRNKIEMKKQIQMLMKKASQSPVKEVTQIKKLMKKYERQAAQLVGEEMYMKQMIELCKERESGIRRREEKEMKIKGAQKSTQKGFIINQKMSKKESQYRESINNAKRLTRKMEIVEDKDKVILSAIIGKLRKRARHLAFELKNIEKKRRVVSGELVEWKYQFDQMIAKRSNEYRFEHGKLEDLIERLKKEEDSIVCKGSRGLYEQTIKMVKERMGIREEEFKDFKDEIHQIIKEINLAHGKCYNGIVDGIEGDQQKCKVCVNLAEFILRQARNGKSKKKIARMVLARCKASDKPHTCYSAAMSLMANFDSKVIETTPLQFCVHSNKCVVRDW
ncbi:hypothetical protein CL6EHI_154200 [Entamoeba histolytica]|uniref:Nuclease sbcCD subunit C n=5 Tax=Entamoeba histolytica TaxID=5759 RepID=B1N3T7_ENTH1|nr:hypothetical protein EHI_154200 [Entamoeba histolytica HM-1:IMSS]EDS89371.1 hypothetical protein EHI_154200 [Entamoeba histolytica HM-1:IMSS]GAT96575.1 hypothetical protein CL6EHI_154200 [Entamoeba histolytica]|eukprot:XP_001913851.1 hypothetical protein EHI_154200 [Entamoeba histolytica HM-1:IMSS]